MQQIPDWLNSLGMSEYAQRFAENRIDFSVVHSQNIIRLGTMSLGHCRIDAVMGPCVGA